MFTILRGVNPVLAQVQRAAIDQWDKLGKLRLVPRAGNLPKRLESPNLLVVVSQSAKLISTKALLLEK